jgi:F0F1-type ATP synthase delta subunit
MDDLTNIRQGLERLLATTAERHQQLDMREQELAAAMELLSVDPRIQAAFNDGAAEARKRVRWLIQQQLEYLEPRSGTATVLRRLSELVGQ